MTDEEGRGDERLRIIWSEALRMIERQAAAVDELRSRAALLLTAGAVVAGFMGSNVADKGLRPLGVVALLALAGLAGLAVFILLPRKWQFVLSPNDLLAKHFDVPGYRVAPDQLLTSLIQQTEDYYDANEPQRKRLTLAIAACCFLLGVEVIALMVRLATL